MTENQGKSLQAGAAPANQDKTLAKPKAESNYDKIRRVMRSAEVIGRFAEVLGGNEIARPYVSSVLLQVIYNPKLQECTLQSILQSALRAATLHLSCDIGMGQAYLVPYAKKATLIIGYKGYFTMAMRTGQYKHLNVPPIRKGQIVEEDIITGNFTIKGKPEARDAKVIGYLFYEELLSGFSKTFYMTVEDIHAHAKQYNLKGYMEPSSPWQKATDRMEAKTVLRIGLTHWGVLSARDAALSLRYDADDGVSDGEEVSSAMVESMEDEELELLGEHEKPMSPNQIIASLGFPTDEPKHAQAVVDKASEMVKESQVLVQLVPEAKRTVVEHIAGTDAQVVSRPAEGTHTLPPELKAEGFTLPIVPEITYTPVEGTAPEPTQLPEHKLTLEIAKTIMTPAGKRMGDTPLQDLKGFLKDYKAMEPNASVAIMVQALELVIADNPLSKPATKKSDKK